MRSLRALPVEPSVEFAADGSAELGLTPGIITVAYVRQVPVFYRVSRQRLCANSRAADPPECQPFRLRAVNRRAATRNLKGNFNSTNVAVRGEVRSLTRNVRVCSTLRDG